MKQEQKAVIKREVLAMSQLIFLICRTYLITLMTNGGDFQSLYHTGNIQ